MAELTDKYKNIIENNQKAYIDSFVNSAVGKLYKKTGKVSGDISADNYEDMIRTINCLRANNCFVSLISNLKRLRFHLNNHIRIKRKCNRYNDYLSIACIVKNEEIYIAEWIEFHILVGVERFYIFDNGSTDNTRNMLQPYIDRGIVIYIDYPGKAAQINAYNDALRLAGKNTKWLAFVDADEFIVPVKEDNVKSVLKEFEDEPSLGVNWIVYGPCGHQHRPEGLVINNYKKTFADRNNELNCRIKSIVQPKKTKCMITPHFGIYKKQQFAVNEKHDIITGAAAYVQDGRACTLVNSVEKIRINHYWTKSLDELKTKCNRGYPDGTSNPQYERTLERVNYPLVEDNITDRFANKIDVR